jgi:virginiamycin B lyase
MKRLTPWKPSLANAKGIWFATLLIGVAATSRAQQLTVTQYPVPTPAGVLRIAPGPDGALWFVEYLGNKIGQITTAGVITEYPVPTATAGPAGITTGPDGALWFTELGANKIGRITTAGAITEFPVPTPGSQPGGIIAGPDGALWFTEFVGNKIGRITTAGTVTEYLVPTFGTGPSGITAGPDGAIWFTEYAGNHIGRITTAGVIAEYLIPTPGSVPVAIAPGPDGALWFVEFTGNNIGRITTSGVIAEYPIPTPASGPAGIVTGPDGALWFLEDQGNKLGRATAAGAITEYVIPQSGSLPLDGIAVGSDGAVWFTESNVIGRVAVALAVTGSLPTAFAGTALSTTFSAIGGIGPYTFTATGVPAGLTLSPAGVLSGTPAATGTTQLTITVKDSVGSTASQNFIFTVIATPALSLVITGLPASPSPASQYNLQANLGTAISIPVTVNLVLTFTPLSGADDPSIQFANGGRTATLTIPAGATTSPNSVPIQTGTVAGTIRVTAQLLAGTQDVTPVPPPTAIITINPAAPVISSVTATRTAGGFSVAVTGFSTPKQVTQAVFQFNPAAGSTLQTGTITVSTDTLFTQYYQSSASAPFGSQFSLTQPFTVQGNTQGVVSVTVTLVNSVGTSTAVTANFQ